MKLRSWKSSPGTALKVDVQRSLIPTDAVYRLIPHMRQPNLLIESKTSSCSIAVAKYGLDLRDIGIANSLKQHVQLQY